ncbi:hypothetical protein [Comamonas sp. SCN 65-56]|uniref:hypothetical protein n=1 Tax=Comamonas sp. SCN 65-56 TaxID=1660095 RepID=UPI0025BC49EA|nr:hypothetical protein [Comamonas sp. SCN 65-56]
MAAALFQYALATMKFIRDSIIAAVIFAKKSQVQRKFAYLSSEIFVIKSHPHQSKPDGCPGISIVFRGFP